MPNANDSTLLSSRAFSLRKVHVRRGISYLAVAAAAVFLPQTGFGLNWDVSPGDGGSVTAGSGSWTLDGGNWNNGTTDAVWANGAAAVFGGDDAVLPGGYNISVGAGLSASGLTFDRSGYILGASDATTLALTGNIQVASTKTATIASNLTVSRSGALLAIGGGGLLDIAGTVQTEGSNLDIIGGTTVNVQAGGNLNAGASLVIGPSSGTATSGTLLVSGGTVTTFSANNNGNFVLGNVAGVDAVVTITSGLIAIAPDSANGLRFGPINGISSGSITGVFNLDGGTLETRKIGEGGAPTGTGTLTSTFNFNGGLLKVNKAPASGSFMGGLDAVNVKAGGARIDTNGIDVTIAQALMHDSALGTTVDGGLAKMGLGALTLNVASTYTGATTISGGTISTNSLANGGTASGIGASSSASSNLVFDGGTLRYTGSGNLTSDRGFTLNSGGGTIEVAHSASNFGLRFAGVVTGSGDLTITRGGTNTGLFFALSAVNTYTGKTFVNNGVILEYRRAAAAGAAGSFANGTEISGATVRLDPAGTGGINSSQTFAEYFTLGAGGTLLNKTLSNTVSGEIALTGNGTIGTMDNAGSLTVSGKVSLDSNTLTVSPAASGGIVLDGGISGGAQGSLAKSGVGLATINGDANTYLGTTTVNEGTLQLSGTLSATTGVVIAGGTLKLGASDRINDLASVAMSGGTFSTDGFAENLGTFTLQGTATIDLGAGASVLRFLDSSAGAANWNGLLTIANWSGSLMGGGVDQLFFGSTSGGLMPGQLAMITFLNPVGFEPGTYGAQMLPTGEIVAVPEPGSVMALIGGIGLLSLSRFRRRFLS